MKNLTSINLIIATIIFLAACSNNIEDSTNKSIAESVDSPNGQEWFSDSKFGMFIHWGPYSVLGGEWNGQKIKQGDIAEWIMERFHIPVKEYRKMASTFNPIHFDAKKWVELAKSTGMKYIIITSKHHDGFAIYDSKVSDYNIVDYTPFGRDPIRELSEECARAEIKFGVYYSHREDWNHPYAYGNTWDFDSSQTNLDVMDHPDLFRKYLDEKAIPQLKELLTDYGEMGIIWFDRGMYTQEQGQEFADLVHSIQPNCLVNGRVGHYDKELLGDYQSMTDNGMPIGGIEEYWETPQTLNDTWGYSKNDQNWKSPEEIIRRLVTIVSKGGNYLLNIGPTGEGIIPGPSIRILKRVGEWMNINNESIYGSLPSPFPYEFPWGYCTQKDHRLFFHIFDWPEDGKLEIKGLNNRILKAYMLIHPDEILTLNKKDDWVIELPDQRTDEVNSVLVAEIQGIPDVDPVIVQQESNKPIVLDYLSANTHGKAAKRFNRKGEEGHFHIAKMFSPDDYVDWHVDVTSPGTYDVYITYAAITGWENAEFIIDSGKEKVKGSVKSTPAFYDYKTEKLGQLKLGKGKHHTIKLYPEDELDHYLMYFRSIELKQVK